MAVQLLKLNFPKLQHISLRGFSLFSRHPEINEVLKPGVFCLAGANGLGKTTFLAAVNYAITGIVADPERKFNSVDEYYKNSLEFSGQYFDGRIKDLDRKRAEIEIKLLVGERTYALVRGAFAPRELRSFSVYEPDGTLAFDGSKCTSIERHVEYAKRIAEDVGVESFEQLTFLQHFVLTFDERRHLLFWNTRILQLVLCLAFGIEPSTASRADVLFRDSEKAGSRGRNAKWQSTQVKNKIKDLLGTIRGLADDSSDLLADHQRLTKTAEKAEGRRGRLEDQQRDQNLRLAELSATQASLRAQYTEEFSQRVHAAAHVARHPLILTSIAESKCGLCGNGSGAVSQSIRDRANANVCPICGSEIEKLRVRPKDLGKLQKLDQTIAQNKQELDECVSRITRINSEKAEAEDAKAKATVELQKFEKSNKAEMRKWAASAASENIASIVEEYERQASVLDEAAKKFYAVRDEKNRELKKINTITASQYAQAEAEFVPIFRTLAFQFLGIELEIQIEKSRSIEMTLVIDVKKERRRESYQLSESQRFFVDIALRMALAQFMSKPESKATLFIDTPEGSLDIAYESRAGNMLASFADGGHDIFMTANINSSQLLLSLAKRLGRQKMHLCRMTSWTEMSEVQKKEEGLFSEAYGKIEAQLRAGAKKSSAKKTVAGKQKGKRK